MSHHEYDDTLDVLMRPVDLASVIALLGDAITESRAVLLRLGTPRS